MYKIVAKKIILELNNNEEIIDENVLSKVEEYISLKNKYERKSNFILKKLDNKIIVLNNQYNNLLSKIEIENKIIKRFFYKLEYITILKNDVNMNSYNDKPIYLFLNDTYNLIPNINTNKNEIVKNIVKTFYNNRHLKFDIPYLYENTITYTLENLFNYYNYEYNVKHNNPKCNLYLFDNINKIKLDYKTFYLKELEKQNNKNKTFNKQLKTIKTKISDVVNENKTYLTNIKEIRNSKIESYRELNKTIYNSYLSVLCNKTSNMDSINEFYFFDTKDVYRLIELIKDNKQKIVKYKIDITNIEYIKNKYNSQNICDLHSNIKSYHTNTSYGDINYKSCNVITQLQLFNMIKNYNNNNNNKNNNNNNNNNTIYPIIIKGLKGFRIFENKTINIFCNFINDQIKIGQDNIKKFENEKITIKNKLDYYLKKKENMNKNTELYNNYRYYKDKLDKLEKDILRYLNTN
jgi:hypothetical protein